MNSLILDIPPSPKSFPSPLSIWTPVDEELEKLSLGWGDENLFKNKGMNRTRATTPPGHTSTQTVADASDESLPLPRGSRTDPRSKREKLMIKELPRRRLEYPEMMNPATAAASIPTTPFSSAASSITTTYSSSHLSYPSAVHGGRGGEVQLHNIRSNPKQQQFNNNTKGGSTSAANVMCAASAAVAASTTSTASTGGFAPPACNGNSSPPMLQKGASSRSGYPPQQQTSYQMSPSQHSSGGMMPSSSSSFVPQMPMQMPQQIMTPFIAADQYGSGGNFYGNGAFSPLALPPNTVLIPADSNTAANNNNTSNQLFKLASVDGNGKVTTLNPMAAPYEHHHQYIPQHAAFALDSYLQQQQISSSHCPPLIPVMPVMMHPPKIYCLVEFKRGRTLQYESSTVVAPGEYVVVGGDRGEDLGMVVYTWVAHAAPLQCSPPAYSDNSSSPTTRGSSSHTSSSTSSSADSSSSVGDSPDSLKLEHSNSNIDDSTTEQNAADAPATNAVQYDNYGNPVPTKDSPMGRVLRRATPKEVLHLHTAQTELEKRCTELCQQKIKEYGLVMSVIDAEYQFDRKKLTFYYDATERQDFRDLVRDLYKIYRARIWMSKVTPK
jgi:hypothetical protein